MKKDQLIDAIGKLDDTLFSEIEASMQNERSSETGLTVVSRNAGRSPLRKRRFVLVALAAVLLIGGAAAYTTNGFGGLLRIGQTNEEGRAQKTVEYVPFGDVRINPSLITGEINEDLKEIPERVRNYQPTDSIMPNALLRRYSTLDEALNYVGYTNMIFPRLNYEYVSIATEGYGISTDGSDSEAYGLSDVSVEVTQKYHSNPDYYFQCNAYLCTENVEDEPVRIRMILDSAETATEQKTVNGRTFSILRTNDPSLNVDHQLATDVFWQENDIIFYFHIVYNEECRADAERVADEWMHSFP